MLRDLMKRGVQNRLGNVVKFTLISNDNDYHLYYHISS